MENPVVDLEALEPIIHKTMKDVVLSHIENYNLQESPLVVMVSGGVDSMVLLQLLQQCVNTDKLFVFHLNHSTRTESNDDAIFVQNYCSKNLL